MAKTLRVDIVADAAAYQRALGKASDSTGKFGGTLNRMGKAAGLAAGGAAIGGLTVALKVGIDEWQQSTRVAAQTEAVLKSTGGVAGVTAKHVDELATSIMKKSGIDDEAIKSTENLLLAFTKIRNEAGKGNDIFDRATRVITDYSVRTGKSAAGATQAFGKALNEIGQGQIPKSIRGVGKLSESLQKEIEAHVKAGDAAGAQAALLRTLEARYGGAAEAAGKTLPGQINILREQFNNLAGQGIAVAIQKIEELRPTFETIAETIGKFMDVLRPAATLIFDVLVTPMKIVADLLRGDWSGAWTDAKKPVQDMIDLLAGIWNHVGPELDKIGAFFVGLPGKIAGTLANLGTTALTPFKTAFTTAKNWVDEKIDEIVGFFTGLPGRIAKTLSALGSEAIAPFKAAFTAAKTTVSGVVDDIVGFFTGLPGALRRLVGDIKGAAAAMARAIWNGFTGVLTSFGKKITELIVGPVNAIIRRFNDLAIPGFDLHIPMPGPIPDINFSWGGVGLPDIPLLAEGGIVTGPTLAMVGEGGPEAIVPLKRGAGIGGITVNVYGNVLSERQLQDAIYEGLLRRNANNVTLGFT